MMKPWTFLLLLMCGFCFMVFLVIAGSVVETFKTIWACRSAWWFMAATMIVSVALFGLWSGLALYFAAFWVIAFFTSGMWETLTIIFRSRGTAV
jgi:hypothetical protein